MYGSEWNPSIRPNPSRDPRLITNYDSLGIRPLKLVAGSEKGNNQPQSMSHHIPISNPIYLLPLLILRPAHLLYVIHLLKIIKHSVWSHTSNSSLGSTPPQILPLQVHASTLLFVFIIWLPLFFQYSISCSTTFLVTGLSSIHHPNSPQETLLQIQHFLSDPILLHTSNSLLESTPPHLLPLQVHAPTLLFSFIVWLILFFQHSIFCSTISNLY